MQVTCVRRLTCIVAVAFGSISAAQTPVRVATWNILDVGTPASAEYNAALDILNRIDADVVAFNEINSSGDIPNFDQLAVDAGYPYTFVASSTPFGGDRNGFMSMFPIIASVENTSADLSGDPSADDITRLHVEITVDVPNNANDLTLVVQHWKSGTANSDEFRRAVESLRIAQAVADLDPTLDAYVIMGDVNEEADSVPNTPNPFVSLPSGLPQSFSLGADLNAVLNGPGILNDPFAYLEDDLGPDAVTLAALQLDGGDATRPSSGRRLDYIMVSQAIASLNPQAEVYDSTDEGLGGGLPKTDPAPASGASTTASDHFLVFADIDVPDGTGGGCGTDPECDDGLFCNGAETCVSGSCQAGSDPCSGQGCDEVADTCVPPPASDPWINEFHYDNVSSDTGEFIEVAGPAGLDLSGWQLIGYNGSGGATYKTVNLSGVISDQQGCLGTLSFAFSSLQNGSPDGIALVDDQGVVVQFLSYEGAFTAVGGPADGMTSTNVGVVESNSTTQVGESLQLSGTGAQASDFAWQPPAADTPGQPNIGQTLDGCGGCVNDAECDDGLYCNGVEWCSAGNCESGAPVVCDDGVACTDDSCNEVTDSCDNTTNHANCDNGLFCDGVENCDPLLDCQAGTAIDCNDGVACTDDSCNETADSCDNIANDANCDNGLFCDGSETCDAVLDCEGGSDPCPGQLCDEPTDTCVGCLTDGDCDDGLFCSGVETCNMGTCQAGTPVDCTDGVTCTDDSCNESADACDNTANDVNCDNGLFCDGVETCDPLLDCQVGTTIDCADGVSCTDDSCNEVTDACDNIANDTNCDNGLFCDGAETCDPILDCEAGAAIDCADGVSCTDDSCNETTDACDNIANDTNCDNGLFCDGSETCDPILDCETGNDPCTGLGCDEVSDQCVAGPQAQLEAGSVTVGGTPVTVALSNAYISPVVVCTIQYDNNTTPVVARVSGVTSNSFDVRLQNPSDGAVALENVSCLIVEEGVWTINGVKVEAQTYTSTVTDRRGNWSGEMQSYGQSYTNPVVMGQVMTENDPLWSTFWCRGTSRTAPPSGATLYVGKHVAEDSVTSRAAETVGFVVFEAGHASIAGIALEAGLGADKVRGVGNAPPYSYSFNASFTAAPLVALTSSAAMDGNDGAWPQLHGSTLATTTSLFLSVDEDQIRDSERRHTTEQVGYVVFESPIVFPEP